MNENPKPSLASSSDNDVNRFAVLATLPPEQMLDAKALAHCLDCSTRTVQRRVHRRELPPPITMGKKSIWTVGRIREWIDFWCRKVEAAAYGEAARLRNFEFRG